MGSPRERWGSNAPGYPGFRRLFSRVITMPEVGGIFLANPQAGLLGRTTTSFGHAQAHAPHLPCSFGPAATFGVQRLPVSAGGDRAGSALVPPLWALVSRCQQLLAARRAGLITSPSIGGSGGSPRSWPTLPAGPSTADRHPLAGLFDALILATGKRHIVIIWRPKVCRAERLGIPPGAAVFGSVAAASGSHEILPQFTLVAAWVVDDFDFLRVEEGLDCTGGGVVTNPARVAGGDESYPGRACRRSRSGR